MAPRRPTTLKHTQSKSKTVNGLAPLSQGAPVRHGRRHLWLLACVSRQRMYRRLSGSFIKGIDKALCGAQHGGSGLGARLVCQNNLTISLSVTGRFHQVTRQGGLHRCGVKGGLVEVDALVWRAGESFHNCRRQGSRSALRTTSCQPSSWPSIPNISKRI